MAHSWDATDYRANASMQLRIGGDFLASLPLPEDASVLDVGCGDGRVSSRLAARVPRGRVVGIDPSPAMVELARREHPELAEVRVADVRDLAYDAEFDAVVSFTALHWVVERHDVALAAMRRALVPGGLLATTFPGAGNMHVLTTAAEMVMDEPRFAPHFAGMRFPWLFPDTSAYAPLVLDAGLAIERLELVPIDVEHRGHDALAGWIRTTWMPYTERLPTDLRNAWIDAVARRFAELAPPDPDGTLHVASCRLELVARRPAGATA